MKQIFQISRQVYSVEKLERAAIDFSEYAHFSIEGTQDNFYNITIMSDEDIDLIFSEYMNYVISL